MRSRQIPEDPVSEQKESSSTKRIALVAALRGVVTGVCHAIVKWFLDNYA
jgi:hypothetical protein